MKNTILSTVLAGSLALSGCNGTTNNPTPTPAPTPSTLDTNIEASLPLIRVGAATATGAVLQFAITQPATRTKDANEMYAAAAGIYSLTSGTLPTVAQFQAAILAFGGTQTDASYAQFTTAISALYASYYTQLASGNVSAKTGLDVLNAIAGGIEDATASYVATPVSPALLSLHAVK